MKNLTKIFGIIVATFFTTDGGVSLSEVNRVQAEHKQQNDSFWTKVQNAVSGYYRQVVTFVGSGMGSGARHEVEAPLITTQEIGGYAGVAKRNAEVSVLMSGLKLWKRLHGELQHMDLRLHVVDVLPEAPQLPARHTICGTESFMDMVNIDEMIDVLKPEVFAQFDFAFWKKAKELNSRAAAIGKLLSDRDAFFRKMVSPLPSGSSQVNQTGVVLTSWKCSYSEASVAEFVRQRDTLQNEYNDLQKQLNSCRKQIKDAVRVYDLEQERQYQTVYGTYQVAMKAHNLEMERIRSSAETLRQEALQEIASLKVRTE